MCAFPLHLWTIILAFRDFSWVTERTNAWDAVGVASYGLVFAFIESLVVFLAAILLGFLVSRKWSEDRRIALLSVLVLVTSFWAMLSQLYFLLSISLSEQTISFLAHHHPLRIMAAAGLVLVVPSVLLPTALILRSDKTLQFVRGLIERLSMLTLVYLFLDLAGLVILIIRNF